MKAPSEREKRVFCPNGFHTGKQIKMFYFDNNSSVFRNSVDYKREREEHKGVALRAFRRVSVEFQLSFNRVSIEFRIL